MTNWEEVKKEWETTKKTYKELEEQFDIKSSTIRSRKNREKWQRNNATQQSKSVATNKSATVAKGKKKSSSNANKKRSGNPNPKNQFAERNTAALKHGLFSRYIPKETVEIMGILDKSDPADLLWVQIQIQYAAIIRAQEIMHVRSKDEMIKELKKAKYQNLPRENEEGKVEYEPHIIEEEYEFQFAWDRQATFLNAQTKAIGELRTSIKQFLDLVNGDDERKLKLQLMQTQIDKAKAETERINNDNVADTPPEITIVDVWTDADE